MWNNINFQCIYFLATNIHQIFGMGHRKLCMSLRTCKSRELRGSILYTDCHCLRRNGLQYDCRRSGCQSSRLCEVLPAPLCVPANVACLKHCVNPHAEPLSNICNMRGFWTRSTHLSSHKTILFHVSDACCLLSSFQLPMLAKYKDDFQRRLNRYFLVENRAPIQNSLQCFPYKAHVQNKP